MFEKIFQKLKDARTANSAVSDRTLETQARSLSTIILTDDVLTTYDAKTAVESLEGNIRHTASEAVKKAQADKEKEAADKAKLEKEEKAAADKALLDAKKANGGKEVPEYVKELIEQNKILSESLLGIKKDLNGMKTETVASTREAQLNTVLDGLPEYLTTPIKAGFKAASFENDEMFTTYLTGITDNTSKFKEEAKKQGLNTHTPAKTVQIPESNGETPELKSARELVNKSKEKANATNSSK